MSYFCNAHNFFGLALYKLVSISHSAYERSFINVEKYKGNKSLLYFSFEPTTRPSIVFFFLKKNLNMTKLTIDIFCNAYIYMHKIKTIFKKLKMFNRK